MTTRRADHLIPLRPGHAVGRGWTAATGGRPVGVTWHWTVTADLDACRRILGGENAERKGEASAHFGVGRTFDEGIHRYVSLDDRSWHAGINQTLQWNGRALLDSRFKASRTTIGIETVTVGYARRAQPAGPGWIEVAEPNGKHVMKVQPWTDPQIAMMIELGKEIVARWPNIRPDDHHGHHDICPTYKQDVAGFPFAIVLRGIYDDVGIPDVWTPFLLPEGRQEALKYLGYDLGRAGVDGDWGRMSDAALRRFQRERGMVEDGMWTVFVSRKVHQVMTARGLAFGFLSVSSRAISIAAPPVAVPVAPAVDAPATPPVVAVDSTQVTVSVTTPAAAPAATTVAPSQDRPAFVGHVGG